MSRRPRLARWLAVMLMTVVGAGAFVTPAASLIYNPDRFDRGSIISDALFYDSNAMSVAQIQSFLNTRGANCSSSAQSADCLKDFRGSVVTRSANSYCGAISGSSSRSAAQIVYDVQRACGISARVLLVTLQKEQGLVTTTQPTARRYEIAMGYGCPDSAPCQDQYYGFSNQMYRAAWQFMRYANAESSFRYRAGGTYNIPTAPHCSTTIRVTIANKATAGLYNYTPYTPNDAALAAYPGGGVTCGAYGNRNFYAFYSEWFGNPNLSTPVVRYTGYSHWWILTGDQSWRIFGSANDLKQEAQRLGREATVSKAYVESFDEQGFFRGVFRDTGGTYYLADQGRRLSIGDCNAAENKGFECGTVPTFTTTQRNRFTSAGALGNYVADAQGHRWLLHNGVRSEVLNEQGLAGSGVDPTSLVQLRRGSALDDVPIGAPLIPSGSLIETDSRSADWYYVDAGNVYVVPKRIRLETSIRSWLGESAGTITAESLNQLSAPEPLPMAMRNGARTAYFLMTPDGIARVEDPDSWPFEFEPIAFSTMDALPRVEDARSPSFMSRAGANSAGSWISGTVTSWYDSGERRTIWIPEHRALQAQGAGVDRQITLVGELFDEVPAGNLLVPSGAVIRANGYSAKMLIDGDRRRQVFTSTQMEITGQPILDVPERVLMRFDLADDPASLGIQCGDESYLAVSKTLRPISADVAQHYMPTIGFDAYESSTCRTLDFDSRPMSSLLVSGSDYWQVEDGERTRITRVEYDALRAALGNAVGVSTNFLNQIPMAVN